MSFISNLLGNQQQQNVVDAGQVQRTQEQQAQIYQQQQNLLAQLQGQGGVANQSSVFNQQQQLANALAQRAYGTGGPSVAQTQLAQATGNNVASQAALIAGARGANANAGLASRQAAMQGANVQQNAVGQAATLAAQEQIAAQNALMGQQSAMGNLATNQIAQQQQLLGTSGSQNLQNQGQLFNQVSQQNAQNQANTQWGGGILGGVLNAAGPALMTYATGGLGSLFSSAAAPAAATLGAGGVKGISQVASPGGFFDGGEIPKAQPAGPRSKFGQHLNMMHGGHVPGQASMPGDHPANDTVFAMLSPGEIVVPRTVAQSGDPQKVMQFVQAVMAKKGK